MAEGQFYAIIASFERSTDETVKGGFRLQSRSLHYEGAHDKLIKADSLTDVCLVPFLEAFQELMMIFDIIGSPLLGGIVRKDVANKITLVREAAKRNDDSRTVRQLMTLEALDKASGKVYGMFQPGPASPALEWMIRVLYFVDTLVANLLRSSECELCNAALTAYKATLWKYHSTVTRVIFERALALLPSRTNFEAKIARGSRTSIEVLEEFICQVRPHVVTLGIILDELRANEHEKSTARI